MISPALEVQSHLRTDTFTPATVDFTSWLSTLDEQELEMILEQIEESPKDKGKERAFELTHDTHANESLATLSSLTTKPYTFEDYPRWRARAVTFPCGICFEDQPEAAAVYIDPCGHPFCRCAWINVVVALLTCILEIVLEDMSARR